MADAQPPIIIKKKKHAHGHHGGAWKLAYADLVTAMMAFFLVMWIIGLDVNTKQGIANYFNNPGAFKASFAASRNVLQMDGRPPPQPEEAVENDLTVKYIDFQWARALQLLLEERRRTDPAFKDHTNNVKVAITDQGLRIDLIEDQRGVFFMPGTAARTEAGTLMLRSIVDVLSTVRRAMTITGHIDKGPSQVGAARKMDLGLFRAQAIYDGLVDGGYSSTLCRQVTSKADFIPSMDNPAHVGNNRVVLLLPYAPKEE
jgi:chemotaxis protein MotB